MNEQIEMNGVLSKVINESIQADDDNIFCEHALNMDVSDSSKAASNNNPESLEHIGMFQVVIGKFDLKESD